MKNQEYKEMLNCVTKNQVQDCALHLLGREFTKDELVEVAENIDEKITYVLQDVINDMAEMDELIVRNMGADSEPGHYRLYLRNRNAYRKNYEVIFSAFTEDDTKEYIKRTEQIYDEFKICYVDGNTETEMEVVAYGTSNF